MLLCMWERPREEDGSGFGDRRHSYFSVDGRPYSALYSDLAGLHL